METPPPLLIRADASVSMGTGHIMRMIALAQDWQGGGGEAVFLCAEITPALEARLKEEGFLLEKIQASAGSREDLEATSAAIARYGLDSIPVALDGYQFNADFQFGLKKAGCRLLVMDDYGHAAFYHADWVLNQNLSARKDLYANRAPHTRLLLGTKFALLRREFLKYSEWQRQIPEIARKVLVTLGGADPDNVTGKVIDALAPLDIEVKVVVGGSNPHLPELQQAVERLKTQPAKIELVQNPSDMPGLMAWADLAIAAGGSTAWELAFMGLPSLFMILAENQVGIATELESAGFGVCLGNRVHLNKQIICNQFFLLRKDRSLREEISSLGKNLVAGNGVPKISKLLAFGPLRLRPADLDDVNLVWEWVNDPDVRASAFESLFIPLEDHIKWYNNKLQDKNSRIMIISNYQNMPIAQVRFEYDGNESIVDLSISKKFRGKGLASEVLDLGLGALPKDARWLSIKAYVKKHNIASQKAFIKSGFSSHGESRYKGHEVLIYSKRNE